MSYLKTNYIKYIICLSIICSAFFLDRFFKQEIIELAGESTIYINDFINFDLTWNTGIGFGLLSSKSNFIYNFITAIIGAVIVFIIYLILKSKLIDKILFSLIIGGAIGNLYDRLVYFAVPDFIDLHFKNFHWFTFNVADIFITTGIIILIAKDLLQKK